MAQKCSFLRQFYFRLSNRPYHYIFTPPLTTVRVACHAVEGVTDRTIVVKYEREAL